MEQKNEQPMLQAEQQYVDFYNLPFTPDTDDIFYFDGMESVRVERWRVEYFLPEIYHELAELIATHFIDFDESPYTLFMGLNSIINTPSFWAGFTNQERNDIQKDMYPSLQWYYKKDSNQQFDPSFLTFEKKTDSQTFRFRRFPISKTHPPQEVLQKVLQLFKKRDEVEGEIYANQMERLDLRDAADKDENLIDKAMLEVRSAIGRLRELGVDEGTIRQLLQNDASSAPYELHILSNGRFLAIPRYGNGGKMMEIRLSPLEKAVYLLFLNHPEGIMFSYLPDHRAELMNYYSQLMHFRTNGQMLRSVQDVTNPTLNSINEKCARIRRVFINALGEANADIYSVTGARNFPKGIRLSRNLVHSQIEYKQ